jgi:hypothetical protein
MMEPDRPRRRLKPQQRAIESALKVRGEFSVEKHPGLCLKSRGDGNGWYCPRAWCRRSLMVRAPMPGCQRAAIAGAVTAAASQS